MYRIADHPAMRRFLRKTRAFYRANLNPFANVSESDLPFDEEQVNGALRESGLNLGDYRIDIENFRHWLKKSEKYYPSKYKEGYGVYFEEKCLEHYLSLQFCPVHEESIIIDAANTGSRFAQIASYLGATIYQNDLIFPKGVKKISEKLYQIGGNACDLPFPDDFADLMVLHCAFEMFDGRQDGFSRPKESW